MLGFDVDGNESGYRAIGCELPLVRFDPLDNDPPVRLLHTRTRAVCGAGRTGRQRRRTVRSSMATMGVRKVAAGSADTGSMGQRYLAAGESVGMRLWEEQPGDPKPEVARDYETVGYVVSGQATLRAEGASVALEPGDSWVVPAGIAHTYEIEEPLPAVEATSPPAQVGERDRPPSG